MSTALPGRASERSFGSLPPRQRAHPLPAAVDPLPVLLLRRGEVRLRALESLCDDPRFEFFHVRTLSPEWRSIANHVAATFVATERDPMSALTYAVTAGVSGPIVMLVPRRLLRERDDLIAAGALSCLTLPVSSADRDGLVAALSNRSRPARVDSTLRLMLDPISRSAHYRNRRVQLSQREFALLYCLSMQSGQAIPADELLRQVWEGAKLQSRQRLDVYIYQLRRKLDALGLRGAIATIRGYGYALKAASPRSRKTG